MSLVSSMLDTYGMALVPAEIKSGMTEEERAAWSLIGAEFATGDKFRNAYRAAKNVIALLRSQAADAEHEDK